MKRCVFIILTILYILSLGACSLSQETEKAELYNSYVVDAANDGIITEVEWEWWLGQRINNKEAAASKKWLDGEKEMVVQYSYSDYLPFSCVLTDFYNGEGCILSYCSDNGKLVGVHYSNLINKDYYQRKDVEDPYHFAKEKAMNMAKEYIEISSYRLDESTQTLSYTDETITLYTFKFIKCINEYMTSDYFYVQITSKGDLRTMRLGDIGIYNNVDLSTVDKDKLEQSIAHKMRELYHTQGKYSYSIQEQSFAFTPEGEAVIVSRIYVNIVLSDREEYDTLVFIASGIET